jgi:hypothetical protein
MLKAYGLVTTFSPAVLAIAPVKLLPAKVLSLQKQSWSVDP